MKEIYNIDKLKICLNQGEGFFENLYNEASNTSETKTEIIIEYKKYGFYLVIYKELLNDKDITAKLFLIQESPFELGTFVFNKSVKYGSKCFFSYSSMSLYECSCIYQVKDKQRKFNYFCYPFEVFKVLNLKFNNVTCLEVALDTDSSIIPKIQYAVNHPDAFEMILLWKKVQDPNEILDGYWEYYQRSRYRKQPRPTLYIHNTLHEKSNYKGLKCYDKARELAQSRPDKDVLTRAWNDMNKNIHRLEITVENKQFKRFFSDICDQYPDRWYNKENMINKTKEEREFEYKYELEHFLYDLGMNEKYRKEIFDYFAYRLLHFKCKNHHKTQFTISDLVHIPKSVLINENDLKKKGKKEKKEAS